MNVYYTNLVILTLQTGFIHQGPLLVLHPVLLLFDGRIAEFTLCSFSPPRAGTLTPRPGEPASCLPSSHLPGRYLDYLSTAIKQVLPGTRPGVLESLQEACGELVGKSGTHTPEGPGSENWPWEATLCSPTQQSWRWSAKPPLLPPPICCESAQLLGWWGRWLSGVTRLQSVETRN